MHLKAAILDWAGTVVDFGSRAPAIAMDAVFRGEGVPLRESVIRRYMGMAKREHVVAILSEPESAAAWRTAKDTNWSDGDVDRMMIALEPAMADAAETCADLIPGAMDAIETLRARGMRVGSTTGYTRTMMAGIVRAAANQGYRPDVVVCAGETAQGRPAPLMIWKCMVELGIWPASAAVVADDAPVGVLAGRHAGCWSVGLAGSGNGVGLTHDAFITLSRDEQKERMSGVAQEFLAAGADFVVTTLAELPAVVEEIEARLLRGESPGAQTGHVWF